jgi:hypothetical protein
MWHKLDLFTRMAWLIVFTEPGVVPVEMMMCICALLTSVVARLAPLHTIADGGSRTVDTYPAQPERVIFIQFFNPRFLLHPRLSWRFYCLR